MKRIAAHCIICALPHTNERIQHLLRFLAG
jgi:hypothetical protein